MKLPQLIIVTAVMFAAGILFPMRRAQAAFAAHATATSGMVSIPRMKMRRRPGGPRTILKSELRSDRVDDPIRRAARGDLCRATNDDASRDSASTARSAGLLRKRNAPAVDAARGEGAVTRSAPGHDAHGGGSGWGAPTFDRIAETCSSPLSLARLDTTAAAPPTFVLPQVHRDVPVPPPKSAAR